MFTIHTAIWVNCYKLFEIGLTFSFICVVNPTSINFILWVSEINDVIMDCDSQLEESWTIGISRYVLISSPSTLVTFTWKFTGSINMKCSCHCLPLDWYLTSMALWRFWNLSTLYLNITNTCRSSCPCHHCFRLWLFLMELKPIEISTLHLWQF